MNCPFANPTTQQQLQHVQGFLQLAEARAVLAGFSCCNYLGFISEKNTLILAQYADTCSESELPTS